MRKQILKKGIISIVGLALVFSTTGCTSSVDDARTYAKNVDSVLDAWFSGNNGSSNVKSEEDTVVTLETPVDFVVDADGSFSFGTVENADYYLINFYDANAAGEGDNYLYAGEKIVPQQGEDNCSGNLQDIASFAYGEYVLKLQAFPKLGDTGYKMSGSTEADYVYSGEQSLPQIGYFWNAQTEALQLQLINIRDYEYESIPDSVNVTFTNSEDASDSVTFNLTELALSPDGGRDDKTRDFTGLTKGVTYDITAESVSESAFVNNQTTEKAKIAQAVTFGEANVLSDEYEYYDVWQVEGFRFQYPRVWEQFQLSQENTFTTNWGDVYTLTPSANANGGYSYDIALGVQFFGKLLSAVGTLNLNSDGTLTIQQDGVLFLVPSSMEGTWIDNGDGTVTLNFNPDTYVEK